MCRVFLFGAPILLDMILFNVSTAKGYQNVEKKAEYLIPRVIITLILIGLEIWFILVVNSFINETQRRRNPEILPAVQDDGEGELPQTPSQFLQMNQAQYDPPPGGAPSRPSQMAT